MQTQVYKQGGRQAAEWRAGQTRRQETSRNARKRENVQASRSRGRASLHEDDSPLIDCTREYSQPVPGGQAVFAPAADLADARVGPAYSEEVLDPDLRPRAGVPHARAAGGGLFCERALRAHERLAWAARSLAFDARRTPPRARKCLGVRKRPRNFMYARSSLRARARARKRTQACV